MSGLLILAFVYPIVLALLPIGYVFVAWICGRAIATEFGWGWIQPAFIISSIVLPVSWVWFGYREFESRCLAIPPPVILATASESQDGFLLRNQIQSLAWWKGTHVARHVIGARDFQYYESAYGWNHSPQFRRQYSEKFENVDTPLSKYSLDLMSPIPSDTWWSPPVYTTESVIREIASGKILAKGSEVIFGGGLLGVYRHAFAGGQDNQYSSCGYVGQVPGEWRPDSSDKERFKEYISLDARLLREALLKSTKLQPTR